MNRDGAGWYEIGQDDGRSNPAPFFEILPNPGSNKVLVLRNEKRHIEKNLLITPSAST